MSIRDTVRRKLTYEDYVHIPADRFRHEILDGEHHVTPAPTPLHQAAAASLHWHLGSYVRKHRLGVLLFAPIDVVLSRHDVAQPDLLFIAGDRTGIIGERNIQGAPDLVVEILSGSTRRTDEGVKRTLYERFEVREYWLVDPGRQTIQVFRHTGVGFGPPQLFSAAADDALEPPVFPGLVLPLREVFG